jgi:hypothetical protein
MYIHSIHFERTGGFAGIRLAAELEIDELPDDEKKEILNLLDELDFEDLPEKLDSTTIMPDGFTYNITIRAREKEYSVQTSETSMPKDLQTLIEILERFAKKQMRKK